MNEPYRAAADRLDDDNAVERLAGLAALQRLGQSEPAQRPAIVEAWCDYLRRPFLDPEAEGLGERERADRRDELEVRHRIQWLLREHVHSGPYRGEPASPQYWGDELEVDLARATLHTLDLSFRSIHPRATFPGARFLGDTVFTGAGFGEYASFFKAVFSGDSTSFRDSTFTGEGMSFDGATFAGETSFEQSSFSGAAWFSGAVFGGRTSFEQSSFSGDAWFTGAVFSGRTSFAGAVFHSDTLFEHATFAGDTSFRTTSLRGDDAWFEGVTFAGRTDFGEAFFGGMAWFEGAMFRGEARFDAATFGDDDNRFDDVVAPYGASHVWPEGWTLVRESDVEGSAGGGRGVFWGRLTLLEDMAENGFDELAEDGPW
ncbi:pentapeptide repeat-containing protein [Saccharomonospora xinjiangensis]|uniref:Low-complexity protein n=1 Tax=Saccharomonospora xinjiangensis XJ-54 TaxID=882086 RepID=I0V072_9PSEU|nr:pentapeptide repeat-containing protein [Saccharomonospora xinjiangensis]EID53525.1 hypothetical protein SacxiDRAFT_1273 [Saccharomonospora xinjiangensis XJ-54]